MENDCDGDVSNSTGIIDDQSVNFLKSEQEMNILLDNSGSNIDKGFQNSEVLPGCSTVERKPNTNNNSRRSSTVSIKRTSQSRSPPPQMTIENINAIAETLKFNPGVIQNLNSDNEVAFNERANEIYPNSETKTDQALAQAVVNAILMQKQYSSSRSIIRRSGSAATSYMASDEDNIDDEDLERPNKNGKNPNKVDNENNEITLEKDQVPCTKNMGRKKRLLKVNIPSNSSNQESFKSTSSDNNHRHNNCQESSGYGASSFSITSSGRSSVGPSLFAQNNGKNQASSSRTVRIADNENVSNVNRYDNSDQDDGMDNKTNQKSIFSNLWSTAKPNENRDYSIESGSNWSRTRRSLPCHLQPMKNSTPCSGSHSISNKNDEFYENSTLNDEENNDHDEKSEFEPITNPVRSNSLNGSCSSNHVLKHDSNAKKIYHNNLRIMRKDSRNHDCYYSDQYVNNHLINRNQSQYNQGNPQACFCSHTDIDSFITCHSKTSNSHHHHSANTGRHYKNKKHHHHEKVIQDNDGVLKNSHQNRSSSEDGYEPIMSHAHSKKKHNSKDSTDLSSEYKFFSPCHQDSSKNSRKGSSSTNGCYQRPTPRKVSLIFDGNRFQIDVDLLKARSDTMLGRMFSSEFEESRLHPMDDIHLTNHLGISPTLFSTILDYYRIGRMTCPSGVNIQELKEACDFFLIPFNHNTVRCGNIRALLHELSNEGAYQLFERFLEIHILPKLVECTQQGERECHLVILLDDEVIDWDVDFPPQLPDDEMNSHLIHHTQMLKFLKYVENREIAKQVLSDRGLKKIRIGIEGYPTNKERIKYRAGIRSEIIYNFAQRPFVRMSWEEEENKSRHVDFQCVKSKSVNDLTNVDAELVEPSPTVSAVALAAAEILQSDALLNLNNNDEVESPALQPATSSSIVQETGTTTTTDHHHIDPVENVVTPLHPSPVSQEETPTLEPSSLPYAPPTPISTIQDMDPLANFEETLITTESDNLPSNDQANV